MFIIMKNQYFYDKTIVSPDKKKQNFWLDFNWFTFSPVGDKLSLCEHTMLQWSSGKYYIHTYSKIPIIRPPLRL